MGVGRSRLRSLRSSWRLRWSRFCRVAHGASRNLLELYLLCPPSLLHSYSCLIEHWRLFRPQQRWFSFAVLSLLPRRLASWTPLAFQIQLNLRHTFEVSFFWNLQISQLLIGGGQPINLHPGKMWNCHSGMSCGCEMPHSLSLPLSVPFLCRRFWGGGGSHRMKWASLDRWGLRRSCASISQGSCFLVSSGDDITSRAAAF